MSCQELASKGDQARFKGSGPIVAVFLIARLTFGNTSSERTTNILYKHMVQRLCHERASHQFFHKYFTTVTLA